MTRQRFSPGELASVLSHYDLDVIDRIEGYPRGSRQSPKVRIWSRRGEFLLKRRAPGRDDPSRVAFVHGLQHHLARRGFPVAPLVGTRDRLGTMLSLDGRVYELFEFVAGRRFDGSAAEAREAGSTLGALHRDLSDFRPESIPTAAGFHDAPGLAARLSRIPGAIAAASPDPAASPGAGAGAGSGAVAGAGAGAVQEVCGGLAEAYSAAVARVTAAGWRRWPAGFTHGDWHPGNLIYRDGKVVAVLDFDSARSEPRAADLANAALHMSMSFSDPNAPDRWPDELDPAMMREVVRGYRQQAGHRMDDDEYGALPWLMIEALVIESVVPVAATGRFGPIDGLAFLTMVLRKVRWIAAHAPALCDELRP